jgi:hypothetical protein
MTISFEPVGVNGGGICDYGPREYFDVNTPPGGGKTQIGVPFRNAIALQLCKFVERGGGSFCSETDVHRLVTNSKAFYFN